MIKIDSKIVKVEVVKQDEVPKKEEPKKLTKRPEALQGATYKIRDESTDAAIYITINDKDGKPYEIFINSKNTHHYQWVIGLTRTISAILRKGDDPSFLIDELKSVHDPNGGYWYDKKFIPSVVAHIGQVIEAHLGIKHVPPEEHLHNLIIEKTATMCPKCNEKKLIMQEGCQTCLSCGYSKCG